MVLTMGVQLFGVQQSLNQKLDNVRFLMKTNGMTLEEIVSQSGLYPFEHATANGLSYLSIAGVICVLMFYSIFIWYRDWWGRSSFIYRLLMLPHSRFSIYLAKFTAMLLFIFSMLAVQLLTFSIEWLLYNEQIPHELRTSYSSFFDAIAYSGFGFILPPSPIEFWQVMPSERCSFCSFLRLYYWRGLTGGRACLGEGAIS